MAIKVFVLIACVSIAFANESEDVEQKKRGAGKPSVLNSVTTGAQKPDYTYNIYSQVPSIQSPVTNYQVPNSFYPNQANQYYTSNVQDSSSTNPSPVNTATHPPQYIPVNILPNSVYQQKYQIVPAKPNGGVQLVLQQSPYPTSQVYPQMVISPSAQNSILNPPGHFNFPHYQLPTFSHPLLSQPSMVLFPHMTPNVYNNAGYPVQTQSVYYPVNSQTKYQPYSSATPPNNDYDKVQPNASSTKEENDVSVQASEYSALSESNGYKNTYSTGRSTYTKI